MEINIDNYVFRTANFDIHEYLAGHLGPRYVEYRKAWNSAGPNNVPEFPIHLDLELSDRCNKKCSFCPRDLETYPEFKGLIATNEVLPEQTINAIAKECAERNLYAINFGAGNEPLMCQNLLDVLELFHSGGVVDSWIITNGVLLDKWIERILNSSLVNLYVSIDAVAEKTYKQLRGNGFSRVHAAVLELMRRRTELGRVLPLVRVSFIEHPVNKHEKEEFIAYWKDKVDFVDTQAFFDYTALKTDTSRTRKRDCMDPYRRLAVHGNGTVVPCASDFGLRLILGDAREESLTDIWRGDKMADVRSNLSKQLDPMCEVCQSM